MDWGEDLKQTLKFKSSSKKGRRSNITQDDLDNVDIKPNSGSSTSSLQFTKSKKSGVWTDEEKTKNNKSSTNLIEEERFNSNISSLSYDDIPIIPDLDDMNDENFLKDVISAPQVAINRVATYKELDIDLVKQSALSSLEEFDISILGKCLQNEAKLLEPDTVWNWENIFTEVSAAIHSDQNN